MAIGDPALKGRDGRRLKNLLIYLRFQLPLICINAAFVGIAFLSVWVTGTMAMSGLETVAAATGANGELFRRVLAYNMATFHARTLVAAGVSLTILVGLSLYLSHKIAGPMVTLRRFFTDIKEGKDPAPLNFRDRDFLMDLPPLINSALEKLKERQIFETGRRFTG